VARNGVNKERTSLEESCKSRVSWVAAWKRDVAVARHLSEGSMGTGNLEVK